MDVFISETVIHCGILDMVAIPAEWIGLTIKDVLGNLDRDLLEYPAIMNLDRIS